MSMRGGSLALVLVPLVLASTSSAASPPQSLNEQGPITALSASKLTVQGDGRIPLTCSRSSVSPSVGFKVGDLVMIACDKGVLARIAKGSNHVPIGPTTPITGLPDTFARGVPVPGNAPSKGQCAAAWNATAPAAAQQGIGALSPLGAQVYAESTTLLSRPPTHVIGTGWACEISFVLPGPRARTATATSLWIHGKTAKWAGFIANTGSRWFLSAGETEFAVSTAGTLAPR